MEMGGSAILVQIKINQKVLYGKPIYFSKKLDACPLERNSKRYQTRPFGF